MNHLANHLWQSTVFAAVIALTAMTLRRNSARLRYWLWLAASLKFLIPFSVLVSIRPGGVARPTAAPVLPALTVLRVSQYFAPAPTFATVAPAPARSYWGAAMGAIWAVGALLLLFRWYGRWQVIRDVTRSAKPLDMHHSLPILSSRSMIEPGVFGLFRPVLFLPEGITDRLTSEELQAVLAHELCQRGATATTSRPLFTCLSRPCSGSIPLSGGSERSL